MSHALLAVAGVLALGFAALAVLRPRVCLVTLVVLDVAGLNGVVAEHVGVSPYRPLLALAVLVVVVLAARRRLRLAWSPVLLGALVLLAGFCLSFVAAADVPTSTGLLVERSRDLFYFLVVVCLVLSTRSAEVTVRAVVLVLAGLAGLTVVHQYLLGNVGDLGGLSRVPLVQEGVSTPRHAGTSSDVNFWARLLVLVTPLSLSLVALARARRERALWLGCCLALLLGTYLTQSRGGFIAVFLALLCWMFLAGGRWRRAILAVPLVLLVVVPLSGIGSRLSTLLSSAGEASPSADLSVLTRKRLQLDAWHMFCDSPAFGHGIGSYGTLFGAYDRLSDAYTRVDIVVAAHNFYLEQAADGGVVLLLAWGVFLGTVLFCGLRARALTRDVPADAGLRFIATGTVAGVVGWAVASTFLHLSDFRALLLVAALAAAVDVEARRRAVPRPAPGPSAAPGRRALVPALAATVVLGAAGAGAVVLLGPRTYVGTATLAVLPSRTTPDGSTAYLTDVISRGTIVPTLARVLDEAVAPGGPAAPPAGRQPDTSVRVTGSRLGGAVVVTVTGRSAAAVRAAGDRAVSVSQGAVEALGSSYTLRGAMGTPQASLTVDRWAAVPLVPAAVVGGLVWRRARRRGTQTP